MKFPLGFDVDKAWDYENGFYLTSHPTRIAKLLAHYELYKSIVGLPGQFVECGVFKGASLVRFATFRELLENSHSRKIIGFDAFGKFPEATDPADAKFVAQFEAAAGDGIPLEEFRQVLEHKRFENVELVSGDICRTVPLYAAEHPELKVAMLHIDVDVYEPTAVALQHLFDRVVPGGLIVLDDYGTVAGATRAVDELLARHSAIVEKLPIAHIPAYIRK